MKIYAWIIITLILLGTLSYAERSPLGLYDILSIISGLFLGLAAYAYAYNKVIFDQKYWKAMFYFIMIGLVVDMIEIFILPKGYLASVIPIYKSVFEYANTDIIISWTISIPAIYCSAKMAQLEASTKTKKSA